MMEVFEHFDTDYSGKVDVKEFSDGLKRLGIFLTQSESKALLVLLHTHVLILILLLYLYIYTLIL
jgi:Ca2+-binding EF-hand superfamily protein